VAQADGYSSAGHPASGSPPLRDAAVDFDRLVRECHTQLLGYIHSLVRDLEDAEDLFQQSMLVLWKKFSEFDRRQSFLAWGCGIARLEVSNYLRVRSRSRLYFSDNLNSLLVDAEVAFGREEFESQRDALRQCVQKLRERDRELLNTCCGEAHGVAAAAQATGRSPQSIYNSLRRIRRALFECIQRTLHQDSQPEVIG
jgi:RNA polymerase sigma-70 factor (ECF subfamily)